VSKNPSPKARPDSVVGELGLEPVLSSLVPSYKEVFYKNLMMVFNGVNPKPNSMTRSLVGKGPSVQKVLVNYVIRR